MIGENCREMASTTLVTVVSGSAYEQFSDDLFRSAAEFFHPTEKVEFLMLSGLSGWPAGTMYRHHFLAANMPDTDYVFLSDADMVFESSVGHEIIPKKGTTATLHPGYIGKPREELPLEKNPDSCSFVSMSEGDKYFCGGFVGGTREAILRLSVGVSALINMDVNRDILPTWHDESALNRMLINQPPEIILSPAYCHPMDSSYYESSVWTEKYLRKLVAIDKTQSVRGDR